MYEAGCNAHDRAEPLIDIDRFWQKQWGDNQHHAVEVGRASETWPLGHYANFASERPDPIRGGSHLVMPLT
jgi:hypothetical protein